MKVISRSTNGKTAMVILDGQTYHAHRVGKTNDFTIQIQGGITPKYKTITIAGGE